MEYKGFCSNAQTWARLKNPTLLRTYLNIAEKLNLAMPLRPVEIHEYDPTPAQAHIAWPVRLFKRPFNHPDNILVARDMIAKHLSEQELLLENYVSYCDLKPVYEMYKQGPQDTRSCFETNQSFGRSLPPEWLKPASTVRTIRDYFARPEDRYQIDQSQVNNLGDPLRWQRRAIDQLAPLPPMRRDPPRGILKNHTPMASRPGPIDDSQTRLLESEDVDNEDPAVKYKPSWQGTSYVADATARFKMRDRVPVLSAEPDDLSAEPDDLWSDLDFDDSIAYKIDDQARDHSLGTTK